MSPHVCKCNRTVTLLLCVFFEVFRLSGHSLRQFLNMIPSSVEEADRPPATMSGRVSPLLDNSPSDSQGLDEAGKNTRTGSSDPAGPDNELPPAPSFSQRTKLPLSEADEPRTQARVSDSEPPAHLMRYRERDPDLGPGSSFEVTLEAEGTDSPRRKQTFFLDPAFAEKQTPLAVFLVALSALFYVAVGLLVLFCISYTSTIFSGIFISAGVLTGIVGLVALTKPSRSLLGVYVFLGLCLFVFMAVAWVLNVTLLIDYVKVLNATEKNLQHRRAWRNSGVPDRSSLFVIDPHTTLVSQGSAHSFPASTKSLGGQLRRFAAGIEDSRERYGYTPPGYPEQEGSPLTKDPQKFSVRLGDGSALVVEKQGGTARVSGDRFRQEFSPSVVWEPGSSAPASKEWWNEETKATRVLRLSYPARIKLTGESLILEWEGFPDAQESAAVKGSAGKDAEFAMRQEARALVERGPTAARDPSRSADSRSLSSVEDKEARPHTAQMPDFLRDAPQLNKHPIVRGCVEGQQKDPEFLDEVGYTITALAFEGILCAYSLHGLLSFHKWPLDCEKTCGFGLLETGKQYTREDPASSAVFTAYLNHVSRMSAEETTMCELYALSTGCSVVSRNYVMVVIVLLSVWIALGVMGCCFLIPFALSRNHNLYRFYKRRAVEMMRQRRQGLL